VRFFSAEGGEEAGVGEGIAKEFLVDVLREGFDPSFGLFATGTEGGLYPDPAARMSPHAADGASARSWYEFLGAVLAKALWEGILVELPLAPFFLSLLLGRTNTVHDMPAFDAQLARSLRLLRDYDGDVEELCLSFAVDQYTAEVPPELRRTHSLVPGGAALRVNASNRNQYILHLSHYRLNTQLRAAADAFLRGFAQVVPREWIRMFSVAELQLVLGGSDAPLNVADWRQHATYSGSLYPAASRRAMPLSVSRCKCSLALGGYLPPAREPRPFCCCAPCVSSFSRRLPRRLAARALVLAGAGRVPAAPPRRGAQVRDVMLAAAADGLRLAAAALLHPPGGGHVAAAHLGHVHEPAEAAAVRLARGAARQVHLRHRGGGGLRADVRGADGGATPCLAEQVCREVWRYTFCTECGHDDADGF